VVARLDRYVEPVSVAEIQGDETLLQSGFWGVFKSRFGWRPYGFKVNGIPLLVLVKPVGGVAMAYIPHGPHHPMEPEFLARLAAQLTEHIQEPCVFLRFDLPWDVSETVTSAKSKLRKAPVDVQPADTVVLDLRIGEEELLASMKSKTRYNIRLADRKGVSVYSGRVDAAPGRDDLSEWYELHRETAVRDRIVVHSEEYYRSLFTLSWEYEGSAPEITLLLASHEDEVLCGMILVIFGKQALYLAGASSSKHRNLMATYALQWEAIRKALGSGCTRYDLFGIPPDDDPDHPMHGLYRFKTGFGGTILHRAGCWDYPVMAIPYLGVRLAEMSRSYYFKRIRKR
jgi:lipid II:glycine glycyltransferase (peptidoglycan interpeptide bridge formation enzyme)